MKNVITEFIEERKFKKLKSKLKASLGEEEKEEIWQKIEAEFCLEVWLPSVAKKTYQLAFSSHPCKFTHTGIKRGTSCVVFDGQFRVDGYLRTGNVNVVQDVAVFNASEIYLYDFLSLIMEDGKTVLNHLEENTEQIEQCFGLKPESYQRVRRDFLQINNQSLKWTTHSLVKQVYFPVEKKYHLLSVLSPSGIMSELRSRIWQMRFSDTVKLAREQRRKNQMNETGYDEIYHLTMIGYGGDKPQNVSVLNKENVGKFYLLSSVPPSLSEHNVRLPTYDFFSNCIWPGLFKEKFQALHRVLVVDVNNVAIRATRDSVWLSIFDAIIEKVWQIREVEGDWSSRERFSQLPAAQKKLLDSQFKLQREASLEWLDSFLNKTSRWIIVAYKKVIGHDAISLSDDEMFYLSRLLDEHKEALL